MDKGVAEIDVKEQQRTRAEVRVFLVLFDIAVAAFLLFFTTEFFIHGGLKPGFGAAYCAGLLLVLGWAHWRLKQQDAKSALLAVYWGIQGITLIAAIPPVSFATLGMIPVMAVLVVLPLLKGREPLFYLAASWAVTVACYGLSYLLPDAPITAMRFYIEIVDIIVASALTLFLIWQLRAKLEQGFVERQELEAKFRQAQKMETVGRLAGGIAHDFNNLITVVMGNVELLKLQKGGTPAELKALQDIGTASKRAASLTKQLLAFSRRQVLQPHVLEVNGVMTGMAGLLRPLLRENIELKFAVSPVAGRVKADPHQLEEALMNLATNARDAMPHGGALTFETLNVDLGPDQVEGCAAGPYVVIAVSDNGVGMGKELQEKIFDPFFTTKPAGQGSGLGLAMVKGIVEQSGGVIRVYSEPGKGSSFKIYLPRVEMDVEPAPFAPAPAAPAGSAHVLVAEDEELVLRLTTSMLTQAGYQVVGAGSGAELIALAHNLELTPDLLVTDVIMPGIGGPQLAQAFRQQWPELKVLFVSGYTENAIVHGGQLDPHVHFLAKPFDSQQLLAKVREVLAQGTQ